MQHFSHEYLEKLVAEQRLVSATIHQLTITNFYSGRHSGQSVSLAVDDLKIKRIQLEAMIDVLRDYLNG